MQQEGAVTRATLQQMLLNHWQMLRPGVGPDEVALCVRCADGRAPTCRFHPDAKGFAFGSGRFDYDYTTLWDTPHGATADMCTRDCVRMGCRLW
jgi:hypothetical protein